MFKFITHKSFFINLTAAIGLMLVIVFLFFLSLGFLTKHDETIKIPNVIGKNFNDAKSILEAQGFDVAIQDSVYIDTAARSSVIRQSPEADAQVKINRTIYLTINRSMPPLVEMPDLRGFSFKSAELYLESLGLKLGDTSYTPDIARNAVKEQLYNGQPIAPGQKINMSSTVDLVLGSGLGEESFNVPDLIGLTVAEARAFLSARQIDIGATIADGSITDTATSFVIKQNPLQYSEMPTGEKIPNQIKPGQVIDIWINKNPPVKDSTLTPN